MLIDGATNQMKVVILAGGRGARLDEEPGLQLKPLIEVGGRPMIWHIMKIYAAHGLNDFVVCLGHNGWKVKEYFANYALHMSDITIDLATRKTEVHSNRSEPWRVTLTDTGDDTPTGGRLRQARRYLDEQDCCVSYCDTLADIDVTALVARHRASGCSATVTAVRPPGRFGSLAIGGDGLAEPSNQPIGDGAWINGGFFVLSPGAFDQIGDEEVWEQGPMLRLSHAGALGAYQHRGFWRGLDNQRDKLELEALWRSNPPWRIW